MSAVVWWNHLPLEIPTKWGPDGPTEFAPRGVFATLVLAGCTAASAASTVGIVGSRSFRWIAISAGIAAMVGGIWFFIATAGLSHASPDSVSPWALATPLLIGYGLLPAVIATKTPTPRPDVGGAG